MTLYVIGSFFPALAARDRVKMGQMLKDLVEKKQNIIRLVMGRNNKIATGRSPWVQRLLIASPPHPLAPS